MRRAVAWTRIAAGSVVACATIAVVLVGCGGTTHRTTTTTLLKAGVKVDGTPDYGKPSPSAPVRSGVVEIAYRDIAIVPDAVRVRVGSTIRWTNYDEVAHNVKSEGGPAHFASPTFGRGGTFQYRVTTPGIIHYECTLEPTTMNGTIEVVG